MILVHSTVRIVRESIATVTTREGGLFTLREPGERSQAEKSDGSKGQIKSLLANLYLSLEIECRVSSVRLSWLSFLAYERHLNCCFQRHFSFLSLGSKVGFLLQSAMEHCA